ncbi:LuxR C-terminal-related transcriptional regulator [Streptomyces stramineus]
MACARPCSRPGATAGPASVRIAELLVAHGDTAAAQPMIAWAAGRAAPDGDDASALRALYWLAEQSEPEAAHEPDRAAVPPLPCGPPDPRKPPPRPGAPPCAARTSAAPAAGPYRPRPGRPPWHAAPPPGGGLPRAGAQRRPRRSPYRPRHRGGGGPLRERAAGGRPGPARQRSRRTGQGTARGRLGRAGPGPGDHVRPPRAPFPTPGLTALEALLRLERGEPDEAERLLALTGPHGTGAGLTGALLCYARGRTHLARDRREQALADLLECGRRLLARQATNPALLPWRPAAASACVSPADPVATALLAEEQHLMRAWGARDTPVDGERHPGPAAPPDRRTAHPRARDDRPLTTTSAPRRQLTAAERRVAVLAADGLPNRAIAAELFVTPRAVELHLTKTYRKLGIQGRPELAAALGHRPKARP